MQACSLQQERMLCTRVIPREKDCIMNSNWIEPLMEEEPAQLKLIE